MKKTTKVSIKIPKETKEETKKDKLTKLLSNRVYKLFDQEPRGSIQSPSLNQLADEILAL